MRCPPRIGALAFDLPGHGGSAPLRDHGLAAVAEAIHESVLDLGLDTPIAIGHPNVGALASIYAMAYPSAAVVTVNAPMLLDRVPCERSAVGDYRCSSNSISNGATIELPQAARFVEEQQPESALRLVVPQ